MSDINKIYMMLNWKNPIDTQLEGIRLASQINNLSLLIQPPAEPSVWEQCAKILFQKKDSELKPYLTDLLEWLQDLNWPGAIFIYDRLLKFSDADSLYCAANECVEKARKKSDETWEYNLNMLMSNYG